MKKENIVKCAECLLLTELGDAQEITGLDETEEKPVTNYYCKEHKKKYDEFTETFYYGTRFYRNRVECDKDGKIKELKSTLLKRYRDEHIHIGVDPADSDTADSTAYAMRSIPTLDVLAGVEKSLDDKVEPERIWPYVLAGMLIGGLIVFFIMWNIKFTL